jgi:protocatechuate 3,4-dioxygenase beta subunit
MGARGLRFAADRLRPLAALLVAGQLLVAVEASGACAPTPPNPQGPFYLPDAPFVERLDKPDELGERIEFAGRVLALPDCRPVAGATLDLWQANAGGIYYNLETIARPEQYRLRGRIRSGLDGGFRVVTVRPGLYGSGPGARPPHIHVTITAPGMEPLTTQVYFPADPGNAGDSLFRQSLVGVLQPRAGSPALLSFDFVLAPSGAGR